MVTIKEVAKRAGVSISTASYALNNSPKVSQKTKQKILQIAKELNYSPNFTARNLKRQKTETIGLFLSDLGGPFYSEIIRGVQEVVLMNGYDLIACSTYGGVKSTAFAFLKGKRVDGAILLATNIPDELILQVAKKNFPIVLLDRELKAENVYNVLIDNKKGAYDATTYLINKGYNKIGCITGPVDSYDSCKRYEGFVQALEEHNLPLIPNYIVSGRFTEEGGYQAMRIMLATGNYPEAIFSTNDEMAIGAINAIKEKKLKIPQDISVIGFDDIKLASYIKPALTTVSHPKYEWGSIATQMVFQALKEGFDGQSMILPTKLIKRKSS